VTSFTTTPLSGIDDAQVRLLLDGSAENLLATWSPDTALFPYASRLHGSTITNDYAHPLAVRYTVNSLLGLALAARSGTVDGPSEAEVQAMAGAFFAAGHGSRYQPADHGLATVLHCALGSSRATVATQVRHLQDALAGFARGPFTIQDAAWILWGAAAAHRAGIDGSADVVQAAYARITSDLVEPRTGLPRHSTERYRRNVVSFGALTYFLRAMHEAAATLGHADAERRFHAGVTRAIGLQGPQGEWPWMIDARTGTPFDFYPVFSVHQDSMAMLFLHPALDRGTPGAQKAIARSLGWVFGDNERGQRMFVEQPFFAYRAIERCDRGSQWRPYLRARRYLRSLGHRLHPAPATLGAAVTRVNDECRSYHPGWILFVWSTRPEAHGEAGPVPPGAPPQLRLVPT
jgi:hypothetical protein